MRDGKWKLLVNHDGGDAELYDLTRDSNESSNVIEEHEDLARRLKSAALSWRASLP
jgi:hypothetical protein